MGRPIDKKFFGPDAGGDGFQITGSAWFTDDSIDEACYIVRQRSNRKFLVADAATGLKETVCKLVDGAPAAEGEMSISINAGADFVRKITGRRVYGFVEGSAYVWSDVTSEDFAADDSVTADVGDDADDFDNDA